VGVATFAVGGAQASRWRHPTASIGTLHGAVFDAVHPSFVKRPCRTTITVWSTWAGRLVSLLADRALHFVPADLIVRVINRRCR
jgi:hypothetical protein